MIICCEYKYRITKNGICLHFLRYHKEIALKERQELDDLHEIFWSIGSQRRQESIKGSHCYWRIEDS